MTQCQTELKFARLLTNILHTQDPRNNGCLGIGFDDGLVLQQPTHMIA